MAVPARRRPGLVLPTAFLTSGSGHWAQRYSRERLNLPINDHYGGRVTSRPLNLVYHEPSGNVVVSLAAEGVVIGAPSGSWSRVGVGDFQPTDFSYFGLLRLLLAWSWFLVRRVLVCHALHGSGSAVRGPSGNAVAHSLEPLAGRSPLGRIACHRLHGPLTGLRHLSSRLGLGSDAAVPVRFPHARFRRRFYGDSGSGTGWHGSPDFRLRVPPFLRVGRVCY